jgi:hypothetical protein
MSANALGRTYDYLTPWVCHKHGYITYNKMEFFSVHMTQLEHWHEGNGGMCESCGRFLPTFKTLYTGLTEPRIDLCETCKKIPDINNIIRDKRKGVYPLLPIEMGTL